MARMVASDRSAATLGVGRRCEVKRGGVTPRLRHTADRNGFEAPPQLCAAAVIASSLRRSRSHSKVRRSRSFPLQISLISPTTLFRAVPASGLRFT